MEAFPLVGCELVLLEVWRLCAARCRRLAKAARAAGVSLRCMTSRCPLQTRSLSVFEAEVQQLDDGGKSTALREALRRAATTLF